MVETKRSAPTKVLRILAAQVEVPLTPTGRRRDVHIERCASEIRRRLENEPADLVVLPELSAIEYSRGAFENLERLAEPLDGPSFRLFREVAVRCGTVIVYGIARKGEGAFHITQVAVGPHGLLLGYYDKLHIAQFGASMEKEFFEPGRHLFAFDLGGFRVAPIICYDIRMPELSRTLALDHGVNLILHCGAYFRDESFETWHAFVTARAVENQCFVLSLNRAGEDWGDSVLCLPWIDTNRPAQRFDSREEELRYLTLDADSIRRAAEDYPFVRDRRDDYRSLPLELAQGDGLT